MTEGQCRYAMVVAHAVAKEYTAPWPYSRSDLAQAALVDIIRTIQERDDLHSYGWMSNRAHWSIRSEVRRLQQFGRTGMRGAERFVPEVVHADEDTWLEAKATFDDHDLFEFASTIEKFTPGQQRVAMLVGQGYTSGEAGRILGITTSAVSHSLRRMRSTLAV